MRSPPWMPTLWLEDAQAPSLALRIETCQRLSKRQRFVVLEPQPFRHDRRPKRQDRRRLMRILFGVMCVLEVNLLHLRDHRHQEEG